VSCVPALHGDESDPTSCLLGSTLIRFVCVRALLFHREMVTYTPYLEDGYMWRKYGQKRITNTRFPR
jgi:hypothetical protein